MADEKATKFEEQKVDDDHMTRRSQSTSLRAIKSDCHYIQALVLKLMHRYKDAQENYFVCKQFYLYEEK